MAGRGWGSGDRAVLEGEDVLVELEEGGFVHAVGAVEGVGVEGAAEGGHKLGDFEGGFGGDELVLGGGDVVEVGVCGAVGAGGGAVFGEGTSPVDKMVGVELGLAHPAPGGGGSLGKT